MIAHSPTARRTHPATTLQEDGVAAVATKWRHAVAMGVSPWKQSRNDGTVVAATKWRNDVAMGVSPWDQSHHRVISPEGTVGNQPRPTHFAPSGLCISIRLSIHGFTPVATT